MYASVVDWEVELRYMFVTAALYTHTVSLETALAFTTFLQCIPLVIPLIHVLPMSPQEARRLLLKTIQWSQDSQIWSLRGFLCCSIKLNFITGSISFAVICWSQASFQSRISWVNSFAEQGLCNAKDIYFIMYVIFTNFVHKVYCTTYSNRTHDQI